MQVDHVQIEILSGPINRAGTSKKTGTEYNIYVQKAYLHTPSSPYPLAFDFLVNAGQVFAVGRYTLSVNAFVVGQDGRLSVRVADGLVALSTPVGKAP